MDVPSRYLVTGGAGFIGSHIANALLERGDAVTILDNLSTGKQSNLERLGGSVTVVRGDIRDAAARESALRDVSGVFHEAAMVSVPESMENPEEYAAVNDLATLALLEDCVRLGVPRFVFAASAAAYGDDPELPKREDMATKPLSPYATSKLAGESHVRRFAEQHGMRALSLRYFNVFGPFQDPKGAYAAAVPVFMSRMAAGLAITIYGDGEQTRDFCYVDNVVQANLLAMGCKDANGQVVNVANGGTTSINELARQIRDAVGSSSEIQHAPERPGDIRHSTASIDLARRILGYDPHVSVQDGLARTAQHYLKEIQ